MSCNIRKNPFYLAKATPNSALNHQHVATESEQTRHPLRCPAISSNFTLQSLKTILCTFFFMFSGTTGGSVSNLQTIIKFIFSSKSRHSTFQITADVFSIVLKITKVASLTVVITRNYDTILIKGIDTIHRGIIRVYQ